MALIDTVKPRIGVFYTDTGKNAEVQSMIDGALAYFSGAGWTIDTINPTALAVEAVILYCKMAQSTDPAQLTNHPVLLSFIAQGRNQPLGCAAPTADPAGGTYSAAQSVTLETTTPDATIRYTTDGTTPNDDSDVYTGPIAVSETTTIKAVARKSARYQSAVMTETYTVG